MNNDFGRALRRDRQLREMTQDQLGEMLGTTQQNVGSWERGRTSPRKELLDKLLEIFGPDSQIAKVAARGPIETDEMPARTLLGHHYPPGFNREGPATEDDAAREQARLARREAMRRMSLRPHLPPEWAERCEIRRSFGVLNFWPDYMSDQYIVEVKVIRSPMSQYRDITAEDPRHPLWMNVRRMIDLGLHQLHLQSRALDPERKRHCILMLISELPIPPQVTQRMIIEGALLEIDTVIVANIEEAAQSIINLETLGRQAALEFSDDLSDDDFDPGLTS